MCSWAWWSGPLGSASSIVCVALGVCSCLGWWQQHVCTPLSSAAPAVAVAEVAVAAAARGPGPRPTSRPAAHTEESAFRAWRHHIHDAGGSGICVALVIRNKLDLQLGAYVEAGTAAIPTGSHEVHPRLQALACAHVRAQGMTGASQEQQQVFNALSCKPMQAQTQSHSLLHMDLLKSEAL